MRRIRFGFVLALAFFPLALLDGAQAQGVPTCQGYTATQWLSAPGTLAFTSGSDVFVGSSGDDDFVASWQTSGGLDIVCGGGGNDFIDGKHSGPGSIFYGEGDSDSIEVGAGGVGKGGSGHDGVRAFGAGVVYGEGGQDSLYAEDGGVAYGGPGNDDGFTGVGGTVYGEQDHDVLSAMEGGFVHAGPGNDSIELWWNGGSVQGGPGNDTISVLNMTSGYLYKITCGLNSDTVFLSGYTGVSVDSDCETVNP